MTIKLIKIKKDLVEKRGEININQCLLSLLLLMLIYILIGKYIYLIEIYNFFSTKTNNHFVPEGQSLNLIVQQTAKDRQPPNQTKPILIHFFCKCN